MKLHSLNRTSATNSSFSVRMNRYPNFLKIWHYHPELELVYIKESTGTRFIGDSIEKFSKGDLILLGENLPHLWLNDEPYFEGASDLQAMAIAIHFAEDFLGKEFMYVPETKLILRLLKRAKQGIRFINLEDEILLKIERLLEVEGFSKLILFFEVLHDLAVHEQFELLCSEGFINSFDQSGDKQLDKVYSYIFKNFNTEISLHDVAEIANMNPSAFSRYFKKVNRKTFSKYLNEIRIGYACKLLIEDSNSVSRACYESGFNNISNFNRQFKVIKGMSPSNYIKLHV